MGKVIHQYKGTLMDSQEEVYFAHWLDEAQAAGFVKRWQYVTAPIHVTPDFKISYTKETVLKTKIKTEQKSFTVLQDLNYTPDFKIEWGEKKLSSLMCVLKDKYAYGFDPKCQFYSVDGQFSWVEVKPTFDMHGKISKFSVLQKILWTFKQLFVDLIIPQDLFKETWMPVAIMGDFKYKKAPTGKNKGKKVVGDWKTDYTPKTLKEYEAIK